MLAAGLEKEPGPEVTNQLTGTAEGQGASGSERWRKCRPTAESKTELPGEVYSPLFPLRSPGYSQRAG